VCADTAAIIINRAETIGEHGRGRQGMRPAVAEDRIGRCTGVLNI
jgi:hypothetical protein